MSVKVGKFAKVNINLDGLGEHTVSRIGTYTLSGITVDPVEYTAFGDTSKAFMPGMVDPGTIEISGYYDPDDVEGQDALQTACENGTELTAGMIKFFLDTEYYLTPKGVGCIIITKSNAVAMDKAGVGTVSFSGKVSGAVLEQCKL